MHKWCARDACSLATGISTTRAMSSIVRRDSKPEALKAGYDWAYREFYRWGSIARASLHHGTLKHQAKHFFYASGWKKFEPLWDLIIRARQLTRVTPLLEGVLSRVTSARTEQRVDSSAAIFPIISSDNI